MTKSERVDRWVEWSIGGDFVSITEGVHGNKDLPGGNSPNQIITILDDTFAQMVAEWYMIKFGGFDRSPYGRKLSIIYDSREIDKKTGSV